MIRPALIVLLAVPAGATPAAMTSTIEALRSQAAVDPAALTAREKASVRAGRTFDQNFTIQTLTPVEYLPLDGKPRKNPPPQIEEKTSPVGKTTDSRFQGAGPVKGVTIDTPVKEGAPAAAPAEPANKRRYGLIGGAALGVAGLIVGAAGLIVGGSALIALGAVAGLLVIAGIVLALTFGKAK